MSVYSLNCTSSVWIRPVCGTIVDTVGRIFKIRIPEKLNIEIMFSVHELLDFYFCMQRLV